ncbi:stromelysin-3-like [Neodiprion lecontei]|uniref:Stromelysin-3-like n=1 Tax=Neodiprion lecontei TaxID=441921 RepID=A0ABM3G513_NEOLC|nr:stromelysin-3-like [Neodiprion lecontei]
MDGAIIRQMSIPRRSVSDKHRVARNAQWKEYRLLGTKWHHTNMTYKMLNQPFRGLEPEAVDKEINKACNMWAEHTSLSFTQIYGKADIDISFDECRSDGPGRRLDWSHGPEPDGRVHFDVNKT